MAKITFKNEGGREWSASTGELIGWYSGSQLWGRGSSGWYITEVDGEFKGIKFDTLTEAKRDLARKYDPQTAADLTWYMAHRLLKRVEKTQANYYASINKGE